MGLVTQAIIPFLKPILTKVVKKLGQDNIREVIIGDFR
jgi:hypothetical protein